MNPFMRKSFYHFFIDIQSHINIIILKTRFMIKENALHEKNT